MLMDKRCHYQHITILFLQYFFTFLKEKKTYIFTIMSYHNANIRKTDITLYYETHNFDFLTTVVRTKKF